MKVPKNKTRLDPRTEFDAMFKMPPKKLASIISRLAEKETQNVLISLRKTRGVSMLSFINEQPGLDIDGSSDNSEFLFNDPMDDIDEVTIVMEDRIKEAGVDQAFCMKCLLDTIARGTVDSFDIDATEVTMYMGTNVAPFMVYKYPANDTREYFPRLAMQCSRKAHEKVVENQKRERDENGDDKGIERFYKMEAEMAKKIKEVNAEDKRPKLNQKDGDDEGMEWFYKIEADIAQMIKEATAPKDEDESDDAGKK